MGVRQTTGLFLLPITQSTGVTIVAFSFALAVGQFVYGAAQPLFAHVDMERQRQAPSLEEDPLR